MGSYTNTPPTFLAGELPDADKFAEITDFMTAATSALTSWTPTWTNLTVGSGIVTARYRQLGKDFRARLDFTYGSGSAVGTDPTFTLPSGLNLHSDYAALIDPIGDVALADASGADWRGIVTVNGSWSTCTIYYYEGNSNAANVSAGGPFVWTTGDSFSCNLWAELA